jgi:hypothetical protein
LFLYLYRNHHGEGLGFLGVGKMTEEVGGGKRKTEFSRKT